LTSVIHDAQNLCWKIAVVLADGASPALLDTYEAERRPVDERNCQRSLENALNRFAIAAPLGVAPENSAEQNMALLRRMWSGRPEDAELRSSALRAMRARSMEFSELNVEYGYTYESAAVVPDDSPAPEPADDIRVYEPSTRPGAPLPHSASRRDLRRDGRSATPRAWRFDSSAICLAAEHPESPFSPARSTKRPGARGP
jgi:2,4-dichlorophenol 6-monooxygenase